MKKILITLALLALASTAWAQRYNPPPQEITLPQYLPPSYKSPHGGTGHADTIKADPRPPIEWPNTPSMSEPAKSFNVTYISPNEAQAKKDKALLDRLGACQNSYKTPECKAAGEAERKANDEFNAAVMQSHKDFYER